MKRSQRCAPRRACPEYSVGNRRRAHNDPAIAVNGGSY